MTPTYDSIKVGDELPDHESAPISRHTLALYCGASGDHNPMHVDIDFAKKFGMPDVFAHGMLSMAYLAQLLTQWVPQQNIRALGRALRRRSRRCMRKSSAPERWSRSSRPTARSASGSRSTHHTDAGLHTLAGDAVIALA